MSSLKEKTALVIGASGGIGSAIVKRLHTEGMNVAISARNQDKLVTLADSIDDPPGEKRISVFPANGSIMIDVESLFGKLKRRYRQIDLVVISSGGWEQLSLKNSSKEAADTLNRMILGNLVTAFNIGFVAGQVMREQGSGLIVNISSHAAVRKLSGNLAYSPAKAGARWFFLNLADELRGMGVKVVDIQPATVSVPSMAKVLDASKQHLAVQPEDIAKKIVELATDSPHTHTPEILMDGDYTF